MAQSPVPMPRSLAEVQDPQWLTRVMQAHAPGCRVVDVQLRQDIRVVASKVRLHLTYADDGPEGLTDLCVKAFLDPDDYQASLSWMSLNEARFYDELAPQVPARVPFSPFASLDETAGLGIIVMEDLAERGARFLNSLETIGVEVVARSVEQLAALHATFSAGKAVPPNWLSSVLALMGSAPTDPGRLQALLGSRRGEGLSADILDPHRLNRALATAADLERRLPATVLHGDCHSGNMYLLPEGPGFCDWQLVQHGHWARDLAYHIGSSLTVAEAEASERALVDHYLDAYARAGGEPLARSEAWDQYGASVLYGYFCWVVTIRVDEAITLENCKRLGHAMMRHDTLQRIERLHR